MGSARGGVGVVALLSLLVVLGYAATALGLPTRGAKTPLTRPELKGVEEQVNVAILNERKALGFIGRPSDRADAIHYLDVDPLAMASSMLFHHALGNYGSADSDVRAAVDDDVSADRAVREGDPKRALAEVALALKAKKKALSALSELSVYGPITETTPTETSLKACAFLTNSNATSWTLDVTVSDPAEAGASGTVAITGLGASQTGTFKLGSAGTAVSQFIVTATGDASFTVILATLTGQTQMLPFTYPLTTSTPPASDCTLMG